MADTSRLSGGLPPSDSSCESAMEKHEACAAAMSSSGLVLPSERSVRDAQVTGSRRVAPLLSDGPVAVGEVALPHGGGGAFYVGHGPHPTSAARPGILWAMRILFVCMGNICRSPDRRGRHARPCCATRGSRTRRARQRRHRRLARRRSARRARRRGAARRAASSLEGAARQVTAQDFDDFDLLLAMDRDNVRDLRAARARRRGPRQGPPAARVRPGRGRRRRPRRARPLLRRRATGSTDVLDLVEAACRGLLDELRADGPA